jgi:hypothetical protein
VSPFNDASTSYYHKSIGGYHGAKLKRYQELIEGQISKGNQRVWNMLNAKYIIFSNQQTGQPMMQQNPEALGNAWFVQNWKIVPNADAEMKEMDSLDFKTTAVIDQRYANGVSGISQNVVDSTASIELAENGYSPMQLTYNSSSSADRLAVFSEIHYPAGWNAYIDGKPTDHIRLNYVLRGLKIPAGKHKIEFKFEPAVYAQGEKMALAGSMMLIVLLGTAVFFEFKGMSPEAKS